MEYAQRVGPRSPFAPRQIDPGSDSPLTNAFAAAESCLSLRVSFDATEFSRGSLGRASGAPASAFAIPLNAALARPPRAADMTSHDVAPRVITTAAAMAARRNIAFVSREGVAAVSGFFAVPTSCQSGLVGRFPKASEHRPVEQVSHDQLGVGAFEVPEGL